MMSGVKAGLVSADMLWREQQELRKQERSSKYLEGLMDLSSSTLPGWPMRRRFRSWHTSGALKTFSTSFQGCSFKIVDVGTDVYYYHGDLIAEFITVLNL